MVVVQKVIMCRLNISDVDNQFCPDYKQMRINEFSRQFVGYCSHGILITSVLEINKSSQIRTNSKTLNGGMHLNIVALVEGILYEAGEIIPDARISKITDTTAVASSKYASIIINIGRVNILKIGDITPVIVRMAQYNKFTDKIAVAANLFVPVQPKMHMSILVGEYKQDPEIIELFNQIDNCKKELKALAGDAKKSLEHFNNLIYPYTKQKKWGSKISLEGITNGNVELGINEISIENLHSEFKEAKVCVFLPDTRYLDSIVYKGNKIVEFNKDIWKIDNKVVLITQMDKKEAYKLILVKYYKYLYTLLQLVDAYPNKAAISGSSHVWKFYEMNRIN